MAEILGANDKMSTTTGNWAFELENEKYQVIIELNVKRK